MKIRIVLIALCIVLAAAAVAYFWKMEKPLSNGIVPKTIAVLKDTLKENSGLIFWNGSLWTHNDTKENDLFELDTFGNIKRIIKVKNTRYGNWEDLAQDDDYIYIGNFGNNTNGVRKNLNIYRVSKSDLLEDSLFVMADTIQFHYEDQTDFTKRKTEDTDFDCEAFIALGDSLYLFTKQWITPGTSVYTLPKIPGNYAAHKIDFYPLDGLITGADILLEKNLIALCGYKTNRLTYLNPFVILLQDFKGTHFFGGSTKLLPLNDAFHQVEAIVLLPDGRCLISNEGITQYILKVNPSLKEVDLKSYLEH